MPSQVRAAEAYLDLEASVVSQAAVHPVARHEEIGVRQLGARYDFTVELERHSLAACARSQYLKQALPADAVARRSGTDHRPAGRCTTWPDQRKAVFPISLAAL